MVNAVKLAIRNYLVTEGRTSRKNYWFFVLAQIIVGFLLGVVFAGSMLSAIIAGTNDSGGGLLLGGGMTVLSGLLMTVFGIATFIPGLTAAIRRLHDTNRSGWFVLLAFIPFIGGIIFLILMLLPGDQGRNQYGDPDTE